MARKILLSNVSAKKASENLLLERATEITALYEFSVHLQRAKTVEQVYDAAIETIINSLKCDRAAVLLFDESGMIDFVASRGLSEEYRKAASGHSPWTPDAVRPEPFGIRDLSALAVDDELRSAIESEGIVSLAFIPLVSEDRLIGKLMLYFDATREFTETDFDLAMTVANQIATGIEQKKQEQLLRENEERLRLATQTGRVGVWDWDIRTNSITWTDSLYGIHGIDRGGFAGGVEGFVKLVHPDDRDMVSSAIRKALYEGFAYELEFRALKPDGTIAHLSTSANVLSDDEGPYRMVGATTDISERRVAENDSAKLAAIVDSSQDAVVSKDLDGVITSWNKAAERTFGYSESEAIGRPITMLIPPDRTEEEAEILERLRRGEKLEAFETVRVRKDGARIDISLTISPVFDSAGNIIGASKIARNITEQKRAEESRRESEIMQRLIEAQEAERHRIARDLHDHLGQKMTALRFKIESLISHLDGDSTLATALDEIQESALQIDQDIGFLSWELRPTELENLGLVDAVASFIREWSNQYGIRADFHSNLNEELGKARLSRNIETNLYRIAQEGLNNVMKHASATSVSVLLQLRKDHLMLIVEDDGLGLGKEFDPNARQGGSFGLIGIHERAALLKGSFEVESRPGEGTTLLVRIPVYRVLAGNA